MRSTPSTSCPRCASRSWSRTTTPTTHRRHRQGRDRTIGDGKVWSVPVEPSPGCAPANAARTPCNPNPTPCRADRGAAASHHRARNFIEQRDCRRAVSRSAQRTAAVFGERQAGPRTWRESEDAFASAEASSVALFGDLRVHAPPGRVLQPTLGNAAPGRAVLGGGNRRESTLQGSILRCRSQRRPHPKLVLTVTTCGRIGPGRDARPPSSLIGGRGPVALPVRVAGGRPSVVSLPGERTCSTRPDGGGFGRPGRPSKDPPDDW